MLREELHAILISLLLHDVTDDLTASGFQQPTAQRYKHSRRQFCDYLDAVEASGLPVVIEPSAQSARTPAVQFTFDDGGSGALHAADLLEQRSWRGLFFITTDLVEKSGFLNQPQLRELADRGHVIGSHSCSHPDVFRHLNAEQMQHEWQDSKSFLQDCLGIEVPDVSVPGGDISGAAIKHAAAAGYRRIYTSEQTTQPWSQAGATCLGRMAMIASTSPQTLTRWLDYPRLGVWPEKLGRMAKSGVKRMIGPAYRNLMQRRRALHEPAELR